MLKPRLKTGRIPLFFHFEVRIPLKSYKESAKWTFFSADDAKTGVSRVSKRRTVHLGEKNRSVVIITTQLDDQLENTQRFLQARDWNVQIVTGALNKGIQTAAVVKADYLFISVECLPNDFKDLYSALRKSFRTILFSEKSATRTLKALQDLGASEVLASPLSGPTIERLVLKTERQSIVPSMTSVSTAPVQPDFAHIDINRISKATEKALSQVCQMNLRPRKALGSPSRLHCFALQTPRVDGYIVIASSGDLALSFSERIKRQLMESMTLQNDFFRAGDVQILEVQEVSFEGLAINAGEFFNKSVHLGNEIAVSFFRVPQIDIPIGESAMAGSVSASLKEISTHAPIDFDIYVYMPLNKKFVLFRRAGGYLETEQVSTLEFHGIHDVHIKKESLALLHRHKARAHINSFILDYRQDITEVTVA